jgi:hypothetical protein
MQDQIDMIEMESLIVDLIQQEIPTVYIIDRNDREVCMVLPTPQTAGTEYQKLTYARIAAERVVKDFMDFEAYPDNEETPES